MILLQFNKAVTFMLVFLYKNEIAFSSNDGESNIPSEAVEFCNATDQCTGCDVCDHYCQFYKGPCCTDSESSLEEWQFSCVRAYPDMYYLKLDCWGYGKGLYGVYMVTKCSRNWEESFVKSQCEDNGDRDDFIPRIPVFEPDRPEILFKNVFCAICNYVSIANVQFWEYDMSCNDLVDGNQTRDSTIGTVDGNSGDCYITYKMNNAFRKCTMDPISGCPNYTNPSSDMMRLMNRCKYGVTENVIVVSVKTAYKNYDCVLCNYLTEQDLDMIKLGIDVGVERHCTFDDLCFVDLPSYSLKLLVNLNDKESQPLYKEICNNKGTFQHVRKLCQSIPCDPSLSTCVHKNCTFVELHTSAYTIINESMLDVHALHKPLLGDRFYMNGSTVYACLRVEEVEYLKFAEKDSLSNDEAVEKSMTFVCLIMSIVCLGATLTTYIILPKLRNGYGKLIINLVVSLLAAQALFLASFSLQNLDALCKVISILIHYFFLVAFCAMNAVGFELYKTFSNVLQSSSSSRRVTLCILYSWALPTVIVIIAVIVDHSDIKVEDLQIKPQYGSESCWINSSKALLVFFIIPLAIFKTVDVALFSVTAVALFKATKATAKVRSTGGNRCVFVINLKLALIMGLTWMFSFVANVSNSPVLAYLFIVCNSLQGVFLFCSLICNRTMCGSVSKKYGEPTRKTKVSSLSRKSTSEADK